MLKDHRSIYMYKIFGNILSAHVSIWYLQMFGFFPLRFYNDVNLLGCKRRNLCCSPYFFSIMYKSASCLPYLYHGDHIHSPRWRTKWAEVPQKAACTQSSFPWLLLTLEGFLTSLALIFPTANFLSLNSCPDDLVYMHLTWERSPSWHLASCRADDPLSLLLRPSPSYSCLKSGVN